MMFEQIYEMENLEAAWQRVRANKGAPGIDRVTHQAFEKDLSTNLHALQCQIREESYKPLPVVIFKGQKAKGGTRAIGISTVRDKVVQQAILKVIGPYFEKNFLPCSCAYRPRTSALSAIKKANQMIRAGNLWALQMDVKGFFDTMDHSILLDLIGRVIDEKSLVRLVSKLLKAKILKEMGLFDNTSGTQQGSGLSPLLSNIYMHPADIFLWKKYKEKYLRYSDDITVLVEERDHAEEARATIEKCLRELKLSANEQKSSLTHVSEGIVYLGYYMDVAGKGPSRKSVQQLEHRLEDYNKVRKTDNISEKLHEINQVIRGWYNYYKALRPIHPQNILSLLALIKLAESSGERALARDLLKQSKNFAHSHPQISFRLGDLFSSMGMENQAMREYARTLELNPAMEIAKKKIRALQKGEGDVHKAIEKIQLVLHHNPDYREGYQKLAEHYTALGLYGFAEKAHQKTLDIDSDSHEAPPDILRPPDEHEFDHRSVDQEIFLSLFAGRKDAHAKQWVDERGRWGFMRVDRPLKKKDVHKHLKGEKTLGVYPVTEDDRIGFIVFDVDTAKRKILESDPDSVAGFREKSHGDILRIKTVCEQMGLRLYMEDSGYKGRHGWLFFSEPYPATRALRIGQDVIKQAGGPSDGMVWELFPMGKSDRHKSIIKLPLGLNRKNNRRCLFLDDGNQPIKDQGLYLKTFQRNTLEPVADQKKEAAGADEMVLPPGLEKMVTDCNIIAHLISKVRDTNYLNHYERVCLLYTLTFAGKDGCKFLHKVIGYCINYNREYTQSRIDRRKECPISCARVAEYFPELAETLSCKCKFKLPPNGYPSPVLYLLESEIEQATMVSSDKAEAGKKEEKQEDIPEKEEPEERILDFERLLSPGYLDEPDVSESPEASQEQVSDMSEIPEKNEEEIPSLPKEEVSQVSLPKGDVPQASVPKEVSLPEGDVPQDSLPKEGVPQASESGGVQSEGEVKNDEDAPDIWRSRSEYAHDTPNEDVAWELVVEYMKVSHDRKKLSAEMEKISTDLEKLFDLSGGDIIHTPMGTIQRKQGGVMVNYEL